MRSFYSIARINMPPQDEFQLNNLGKRITSVSIGMRIRTGPERNVYEVIKFEREVTEKDYDWQLISKFPQSGQAGYVEQMLDYHLLFYIFNKGEKEDFVCHIRAAVLPLMEESRFPERLISQVIEWLNENTVERSVTYSYFTRELTYVSNSDIHSHKLCEIDFMLLKTFKVKEYRIEELKKIFLKYGNDKAVLAIRVSKWLEAVGSSMALRGIYHRFPAVKEFICNIYSDHI